MDCAYPLIRPTTVLRAMLASAAFLSAATLGYAAQPQSAWSVTRDGGRLTAGTTSLFNPVILTITCRPSIRGDRYTLSLRRTPLFDDIDGDATLSVVVQSPNGQVRDYEIAVDYFDSGRSGRAAGTAPPQLIRALRRGARAEAWISETSRGSNSHLAGQFRLDGSGDAIAAVTAGCR
ncbi:MAG: hypothetical protein AAF684_03330 [Pseudomonadota bacterium]